MDRIPNRWRAALIAALLGAVTLAVFWPLLQNDFIRYDDRDYVTANPHVLGGLTWEGAKWAFGTGHASNWHPVTWLSHMLDVELFGLRPGWHHFSSLALHIVNTILLFLLLWRLTAAEWRSAFLAGFFALHPLHVESVAWVAERKDVLSGAFFLLTLLNYAAFAQKHKGFGQATECKPPQVEEVGRTVESSSRLSRITHHASFYYCLSLALFALGLMSKPMLVTVPFVLLLLDVWPLQRLSLLGQAPGGNWLPLLREKIPFFALALVSGVITYAVQGRGHAVTITLPLGVRVGNAVMSYWKYLVKTFWPADLVIFYPHPATRYPVSELWPLWLLAGAALLLIGVSAWAVRCRARAPWFTVGWWWYVGILFPVIGLVQVGQQAMADRYTYLPLIGIFVGLVWGGAELSANRRWARQALAATGILALVICAGLTQKQARYWRDNLTVFKHALAVNPNNAVARCHVGIELGEQHNYQQALEQFQEALKADPNSAEAYYGLGFTLENLGKLPEAIEQYRNAVGARPWYEPAHSRLGTALWSLGQREQAMAEYETALRQNPDDLEVQYRLGLAFLELGELGQAVPHLGYVARLNPDFGNVVDQLTEALLAQGRLAEAEGRLGEVAARFPANPQVRIDFGRVLSQGGKADAAIAQYREALRLDAANPAAHYQLGTLLSMRDQLAGAALELAEAVRLKSDYLAAHVRLGEVLAGQHELDGALTQFREAVRLAPTNANLVLNLGNVLVMAGRTNEAATAFAEAVRLQPDLPQKLAESGAAFATQGNPQAAVARFTTALNLKPDAQWCFELAGLLQRLGQSQEAVRRYEHALQLKPDWTEALNSLAWVLATDQRAEVRNGNEAVRLAERACHLDGNKDARLVATLAAAYAEVGRFSDAVATAEKGRGLASAAGKNEVAAEIGTELEAYRKQMPWRK